ncbi:hypothetical protein HY030_03205 [Candidatus Gottesmanbacteria bacterium]|nr:hypothetical protein [Candidatus Gottesmanbacteria bacterium]
MSSLPNKPKDVNPKNPKVPLVRDASGKFVKSDAVQSLASTQTFGKENQPNFEEVYLEDAERTKELKEQLAELEKEAEVKEIKGEIELPEMVKKEGVEVVGEEVPIPTQPTLTLPLDDQKIYKVIKNFRRLHQNVKDSITWLSWWCFRQLQLVGIKLKEVHGKIIRETN